MKRLLFLLICFTFFVKGKAQINDTSKLRVYTKASKSIIKLNDKTIKYGEFQTLDTGKYTIKVWAPTKALVEKTVILRKNELKTVPIKLPNSKEYKRYKASLQVYNYKKYGLRYGFVATYLVFASTYLADIKEYSNDADRFKSEAENFKNKYDNSFWASDLDLYKQKYDQSRENYNDALNAIDKRTLAIQIGAGIAIVTTYFGWKISNSMVKPTYSEKPLLSDISITPLVGGEQAGMMIRAKF